MCKQSLCLPCLQPTTRPSDFKTAPHSKEGNIVLWKDAMAETVESFGLWDTYKGNVRVK